MVEAGEALDVEELLHGRLVDHGPPGSLQAREVVVCLGCEIHTLRRRRGPAFWMLRPPRCAIPR